MKRISIFKHKLLLISLLAILTAAESWAFEHPIIWADSSDRTRLQEIIAKYQWGAECFEDLKKTMAPKIASHKKSPIATVKVVPAFPDGVHPHSNMLDLAIEAGVLYFMTGEEDYAQYSADILNVYVQELGRDDCKFVLSKEGTQRDYREVYPRIGITYDFIQPFLIKKGTTVFDKSSQTRTPFDNAKAQHMLGSIVDNGFEYLGGGTSNLTIMIGAGIIYPALCIEDKEKRDAYVQTYMKGSKEGNGFHEIKQSLIDNNGIWPESTSYSGVGRQAIMIMENLDRAYPDLKIFSGFDKALSGDIDRLFYVYPNESETVCFGDAHRESSRGSISEFFTRVFRRAGAPEAEKRVLGQMKAEREKYGYAPRVKNGDAVYKTFLSMDPLEGYEAKSIESQAVHLPYAGVVIQNNLNCKDKKEHGLMYYTGGAHYVHAHLSGLDMELYGAGCVMGGVGGSAEGGPKGRSSDIFVNYYRNYAAHNTVVVNGKSVGGKQGWKGYNMMWMDTVKLDSMEPKPYTTAVSKDFTFSSQVLNDTINKCTQQRIVSMIRTSDSSGYYLDLFRSRSKEENKFHDYIYHNIGDSLIFKSATGEDLELKAQEGRYETVEFKGRSGTLKFPGWHCFTDVHSSPPISDMVFGRFEVKLKEKRFMYVVMPSGAKREYTSAAAPPIFEGAAGYEKKPARVLSIRQSGEAWDMPFIVAYEPSANMKPTIQSIENIVVAGKVIGAKVVSKVGEALITDRIIAQDNETAIYENAAENITFKGRFAIVRTIQSAAENTMQLYIGDGDELTSQGHKITAGKDRTSCKVIDL